MDNELIVYIAFIAIGIAGLIIMLTKAKAGSGAFSKSPKAVRLVHLLGKGLDIDSKTLRFSGGLHIDGTVRLNLEALPSAPSIVSISQGGRVEGNIHANDVIIAGTVVGSIHAENTVEVAPSGRISGNVKCLILKKAPEAQVTGTVNQK